MRIHLQHAQAGSLRAILLPAMLLSACWSPDVPVNSPQPNPLDEAPPAASAEPDPDVPGYTEPPAKKNKFDEEGGKVVLSRAARNAHSCLDMAGKDAPRGKPQVLVTFAPEGKSSRATIPPPYEGTQLGQCVTRAFVGIVVPPFDGAEIDQYYEVDLTDAKGAKPADAPAAKPGKKGKKKK